MQGFCVFAAKISASTINSAGYSSHDQAHAEGICARLWAADYNPTGEPLWNFKKTPYPGSAKPAIATTTLT